MPEAYPDPPYWAVGPEEAGRLLAAYRTALAQAKALTAACAQAGCARELLSVTANLDAAGRPQVRAVITFTGARRLAAYLEDGGSLPAGLATHDGYPPWAA